jgi:acyl-CoA synthetase (AMP-forming)/AMP-acid ligase II
VLIHHLLERAARCFPGTVAAEDAERQVDFAALRAESRHLAAVLGARGVGAGDRVAVLSKNRIECLLATFACSLLGAVSVPLHWRLRPAELEALLLDAQARALLGEGALLRPLAELPVIEGLAARLRFDDGPGAAPAGFDSWRDGARAGAQGREPSADDAVVQMYTSGTTGRPKGALLTHRNLTAMVATWLFDMPLRPGRDRFLHNTPLFHVGGLLMALSNVAAGTTFVLRPEFEPGEAARLLSRGGITHTLLVPAMVQWLLAEPGTAQLAFPDLRLLVYGAAPMPEPLARAALERFGCDFLQGYGLTETAGVLTTLRPEDHRPMADGSAAPHLASAGRPVHCAQVRVADEGGVELPCGAVGEVVARGANLSPGYWRRPEETTEAWRGGWFHTGDLGQFDEQGFLTLVDRAKDMVLVGGENVYPREIELVLLTHPAVADCAVYGVPHPVWGEAVRAEVVLRPGTTADPRALIGHCRAVLARFKCPTELVTVDTLPRNAAGKLQKELLRAPHWEGRARRV